jgi:hypothetical protein
MATIREEAARLKWLVEKGRGDERCHIVLIEVEARERISNPGPKPKTKFALETDDPKLYSRFNELKDRWFRVANKSVALTVMFDLWDRPVEWIKETCDTQGDRCLEDSSAT